jgi:3-hydroxybutyryl-CoA dehydrogenase
MEIERVGVVGGGLMGSGIAEVCARAGIDVVVREQDAAAVDAARARIQKSLERGLKGNKISAEDAEQTEARLQFTTEYDALNDRQLVVEAVFEDEATKVECFRQLDGAVKSDDAILASNTSSIPIMKLAVETKRPAFVCGIHFFNPVPVLELVELVPSLMTSAETAERSARFASEQLGKVVVRSQDRAGFVVNALLVPYILSAIRMAESGFATPEDIDAGMVKGCNHPMGPLALADLIGLDTTMAVAQSMYEEFKEPLFAPPPMLCRMVEAGLLGRKSKRGFYQYQR